MAYAHVMSACVSGAEVVPIAIEIDIQPGLPQFTIIGLPDKQIEESRLRVRSAMKNAGLGFPKGRITANLRPSGLPKNGTGFDLGLVMGILLAEQKIRNPGPDVWFLGELSLDSNVRPVQRLEAMLIEARRRKLKGCVISSEYQSVPYLPLVSVQGLAAAVQAFQTSPAFIPPPPLQKPALPSAYSIDLIYGQIVPKRILLVALAGGFNVLFSGPPGVGKTMLARAAAQLLPPLSEPDLLYSRQLYSIRGEVWEGGVPFRAPHHSFSLPAILGGGATGKPGELTLAHKGILFLDEFPEFRREVREALREPMEEKKVRISRQGKDIAYPADCLVIAAQNACPCGRLGASTQDCRCTQGDINAYARKLSQPLLDRFQLFCEVGEVAYADWRERGLDPDSLGAQMTLKIAKVRTRQRQRKGDGAYALNDPCESYLKRSAGRFGFTPRAMEAVVKVARTIADIGERDSIQLSDIQEAVQYRHKPAEL